MGVGALMFFLFMRPSEVKKLLLSLAGVFGVLRPQGGSRFRLVNSLGKDFYLGRGFSLIGWCMPV